MVEPDELRMVVHHTIIYSSGSSRYPANVVGTLRNGGNLWYFIGMGNGSPNFLFTRLRGF
jgi:hypothetical protein